MPQYIRITPRSDGTLSIIAVKPGQPPLRLGVVRNEAVVDRLAAGWRASSVPVFVSLSPSNAKRAA